MLHSLTTTSAVRRLLQAPCTIADCSSEQKVSPRALPQRLCPSTSGPWQRHAACCVQAAEPDTEMLSHRRLLRRDGRGAGPVQEHVRGAGRRCPGGAAHGRQGGRRRQQGQDMLMLDSTAACSVVMSSDLRGASGHFLQLAHAQPEALQLSHKHSITAPAAQIRRQRIRDAAATKSQWREKVEALKKEEAELQPKVDRLQSALLTGHALVEMDDWKDVQCLLSGRCTPPQTWQDALHVLHCMCACMHCNMSNGWPARSSPSSILRRAFDVMPDLEASPCHPYALCQCQAAGTGQHDCEILPSQHMCSFIRGQTGGRREGIGRARAQAAGRRRESGGRGEAAGCRAQGRLHRALYLQLRPHVLPIHICLILHLL